MDLAGVPPARGLCCAGVCGPLLVVLPSSSYHGFFFLFFTVCPVHVPPLTETWQALVQMEPAALNAVLYPEPLPASPSSDAVPSGHTEAHT